MQNTLRALFGGRRTLLALSVVLVGLHLAKSCIFVAVGQPPLEGDARHYWNDGDRMASGDWLMARGDVETVRTPGYPLFLALFQLAFGLHALIAAAVCQQLMVVATAMVAAWMCARISGNWLGGLCGLALGMFCVSQNSVADYMLSDTLFALLLTLAVAALITWFERPGAVAAISAGLLLGLATLVRPIAQYAWAPILVAMAFRWSRAFSRQEIVGQIGNRRHGMPYSLARENEDLDLRRLLAHGACFLGVFAAVLAPWYARNYCFSGQAFLSKTAGITMWKSLFKSNSPLDPAVPFADAPKTKALLARLDGVDLQSHWAVLKALENQELTRLEANDRMQEVCLEAIKAHPGRFVDSRLRRFAWFWITPNGTRRPGTAEFHMYEDRPNESPDPEISLSAANYCGQAHWHWDGYYRNGKLNWLWHPNPWLYLFAASVTVCSVIAMLLNQRQRPIAIACGLLLAYFGTMTAVGAPPEYRYRMPLEPMMVACVASVVMSLAQRLRANQVILARGT